MTDQTSAQDVARKVGKHPGYKLALKIIEDWPVDGREYTKERWLADLINTLCRDRLDITAALQAERARTIEECAKIMCHNCFKGTPFNADGQHIITEPSGNRYPRDCAAHEIRALAAPDTGGTGERKTFSECDLQGHVWQAVSHGGTGPMWRCTFCGEVRP
jgi:hypothetical protein